MCPVLNASWTALIYRLAEPGFYADGRFGIRIENVVVVREVKTPNNFGDKGFLGFERLTMVTMTILTELSVTDSASSESNAQEPDRYLPSDCFRADMGQCLSCGGMGESVAITEE